ncbi:MAG TPA: HEAT repeat domain-containing protein, partial [Polyangia bacterium]
ARQGDGPRGAEARKIVDDAAEKGTPAVRGLVGAKAGDALAEAARSPDLAVRAAALEAAGQVGAQAGGAAVRDALVSALSDASEGIRVAAARGLVGLGPQAGEQLEKALADPSRDVREAAVEGLGVLWAELPASELQIRLRDETHADRRYAAALALARQGDGPRGAEARKIVDDAAEKGTPAVRLTARVARAFAGRADEMAGFVRLLRDGT